MSNNDFTKIAKAVELANPIFQEQVPDLLQSFETLWKEKTQEGITPTIMLYGLYSSGKSTLVNALLGKEIAEIGRSPTTDKISVYQWEGGRCALIDTPGIQARNEDTLVTEKQLMQCELVVFVVESSTIENKLVWDTLVKLVAQEQKVCLFINDFDKVRDDACKFEPLKDKFRSYLQDSARAIGFSGDITSKVKMLIADARLGLKGKIENKNSLLIRSGLPEIEEVLVEMAANIDRKDAVKTLKRNVRTMIATCRGRLAAKNGNEILAQAEEQLSAIKSERERAYSSIEWELNERISLLRETLHQMFSQNSSEESIRTSLESLTKRLVQEMNDVIQQETKRSAKQIKLLCEEFDQICHRLLAEQEGQAGSGSTDIVNVISTLNWEKLLEGMDWETMVKEAVVKILQKFKDWFPALLTGKGTATFGKWAGVFTNTIGAIISIGITLFQMYSDAKAEQEACDRARRQAQAIVDAVEDTQKKLHNAIMAQVKDIFSESFDKAINEISIRVNTLRHQSFVDEKQRNLLDSAENVLFI